MKQEISGDSFVLAHYLRKRGWFGAFLLGGSCVVAIGLAFYIISSSSRTATADNLKAAQPTQEASTTSSIRTDLTKQETGPSGLPIPRFVSLKRSKVNVRLGPSSEHKIAWIFHYKGLPVEIIAEFEHWRRIRDSDGQEGWVYHSLLTGKRTATVAPWRKGTAIGLLEGPKADDNVIANVNAGAVGDVKTCNGAWCQLNIKGYEGWIQQTMLWGVYPNETITK